MGDEAGGAAGRAGHLLAKQTCTIDIRERRVGAKRDGDARILGAMVTSARWLVVDRKQERQCILALAAWLDACCKAEGEHGSPENRETR